MSMLALRFFKCFLLICKNIILCCRLKKKHCQEYTKSGKVNFRKLIFVDANFERFSGSSLEFGVMPCNVHKMDKNLRKKYYIIVFFKKYLEDPICDKNHK